MIRSLIAAALVAATPLAAAADEVWSLPSGNQVVYDRDVGETAVFSYKAEQGLASGWIFVPGLAGVYEGRGTYRGYWVEEADAGDNCAAGLVDAEGKTWRRWGLAEIKFAKPTFPSKIRIARGNCLNGFQGKPVTAKPVIGAGVQ
jgi:hypothetical protein